MRKIDIGGTGLSVSQLCHGTLVMGAVQANIEPEQGARAIEKSLELGVNFFDTAKAYGTYRHLALGLKGVPPEQVVVASKSHATTYEEMKADIEDCLRALSLERIGIFHLHLVNSAKRLDARRGALDCLIDFKRRGLVTAIGASTHHSRCPGH